MLRNGGPESSEMPGRIGAKYALCRTTNGVFTQSVVQNDIPANCVITTQSQWGEDFLVRLRRANGPRHREPDGRPLRAQRTRLTNRGEGKIQPRAGEGGRLIVF